MSFDLRIYVSKASFPPDGWQDLVGMVGAEERPADGASTAWEIVCDDASVWINVSPVRPTELCSPPGAHWLCNVSTSAGRSLKSLWAQFAMAYYALLLLDGVSVHDCQHHEYGCFEEAAEFKEFAAQVMPKLARKRALVKQGLMTQDGKVAF